VPAEYLCQGVVWKSNFNASAWTTDRGPETPAKCSSRSSRSRWLCSCAKIPEGGLP